MAGVTLPLDQVAGNGRKERTTVSGGALLAPARRGLSVSCNGLS